MQYPIKINEKPHRGSLRTWTLYDKKHLNKCIEQADRSGYSDWAYQEGLIEFEEQEDGEIITKHDVSHTLDAYLDWLRHDLSQLIVEEE